MKRQYAVTQSDYPLQNPNENVDHATTRIFFDPGTKLDKAVDNFTDRISSYLDTGAVQLWERNENNQTWSEIGSLYL